MTLPALPTTNNNGGLSGNVVVIAVASMFVSIVAAAVFMVMAAEDGARIESLMVILLGAFTTTGASLASLYVAVATKRQVDFLANGGTDAKIRAGIADMLPDHMIRPEASDQLVIDRAVRDRAHQPAAQIPSV